MHELFALNKWKALASFNSSPSTDEMTNGLNHKHLADSEAVLRKPEPLIGDLQRN